MKKLVSAKARDDYTIELTFSSGCVRIFDARPYLDKGIFRELKDLDYFKRLRIAYGTVQWENEQDFAPETLYVESEVMGLES